MRLLFSLLFLGVTLFACPNSCNHKDRPGSLLETLHYALIMMDLNDNADIKTAISLYKRDMKTLDQHMNTDAFQAGKFDPQVYRAHHAYTKKIDAQIELLDTLYLILDDAQKERLHQLMAGHVHYLDMLAKESFKGCNANHTCNGGMHQNCAMHDSCDNGTKNCMIKACDTKTLKGCNKTRP